MNQNTPHQIPNASIDDVVHLETMFEQHGYEDGLRQGQRQGHLEGLALGIEMAFEMSREVGWHQGVAMKLLDKETSGIENERAIKGLESVLQLCQEWKTSIEDELDPMTILTKIRSKFRMSMSLLGITLTYPTTGGNTIQRLDAASRSLAGL